MQENRSSNAYAIDVWICSINVGRVVASTPLCLFSAIFQLISEGYGKTSHDLPFRSIWDPDVLTLAIELAKEEIMATLSKERNGNEEVHTECMR